MPRRIEITVPADLTGRVVERLAAAPGVLGLRVQSGISRDPEGDVITVDVLNRALADMTWLLADLGVGSDAAASFSTSEPISLVASHRAEEIAQDSSEASWEEMEVVIGKNSNMTVNALIVMAIAGVLATVGIATNALHVVVGAMLIAPGFQPIVRIGLGLAGRSRSWQRGILHTVQGYLALAVGAAAASALLRVLGKAPIGSDPSYLPAGVLVGYWTTIEATSLLITFVAGAAGAILVATNRAVLTAGVMVALALVPAAALIGAGAAAGDLRLAAIGGVRWLLEAAIVLSASTLVFAWKRAGVHRRPSLL
jgi:hypothetical protein